jgi:type IV pilus assembly protein PilA
LRLGAGNGARRRRAGFTLVEVIVVLVILAILAAIAVPALTGYIDKAKMKTIEAEIHTQRVAIQTMIIEEKAAGKLASATVYNADPDRYFITFEIDESGDRYFFAGISLAGIKEYEKLTGETGRYTLGVANSGMDTHCSMSGAIRLYHYTDSTYFNETDEILEVIYIADANDPLFTYYKDNNRTNLAVGTNIYKRTGASSPYTYEKLN